MKEVKFYKDHAVETKFKMDCPYLQAIEIYKISRNDLLQIGWKKEANKLLTSIASYEDLLLKDKGEREKLIFLEKKRQEEERQLEETVRLQKEEQEKLEKERIQQLQKEGKRKEYEEEISKRAFSRIENMFTPI